MSLSSLACVMVMRGEAGLPVGDVTLGTHPSPSKKPAAQAYSQFILLEVLMQTVYRINYGFIYALNWRKWLDEEKVAKYDTAD